MNWLLISVITLWLVISLIGMKKGFIRMLYTLCSFVVGLILTVIVSPIVEDYIIENTETDEFLSEKYTKYIAEAIEDGETALIEGLISINEHAGKDILEVSDGTTDAISDENLKVTADRFAESTIGAVTFVVIWIAISLLLRLLLGVIKIIELLPVIKSLNRILGLLSGAIVGLFVIWIFFAIITICSTTEFGTWCMKCIGESEFLTILFKHNILLK